MIHLAPKVWSSVLRVSVPNVVTSPKRWVRSVTVARLTDSTPMRLRLFFGCPASMRACSTRSKRVDWKAARTGGVLEIRVTLVVLAL